MTSVLTETRSVYPSGGDLATWSKPITPAAPVLLSTITGCFRRSTSFSAMTRASTSTPEPAENGTTIRTSRAG